MKIINEYKVIKEINNELKPKTFYIIKNNNIKLKNEKFLQEINFIYNNIKYKNKCYSSLMYKNILKKIENNKNVYQYYYYIDIKNAYNSVYFDEAFLNLKKYISGDESSFFEMYKFYNFIYTYIQKNFLLEKKTLFLGLDISTLLFNLLIKDLLNQETFSSYIYYFFDDFLFCNNNLENLKNDKKKFELILKNYNLEINKKKTKLIDLNQNNHFIYLNTKFFYINKQLHFEKKKFKENNILENIIYQNFYYDIYKNNNEKNYLNFSLNNYLNRFGISYNKDIIIYNIQKNKNYLIIINKIKLLKFLIILIFVLIIILFFKIFFK